jgi:hypothetical protein
VTFDASDSFLPLPGTTFYFLLHYGELNDTGIPQSFQSSGTSAPVVSYIYTKPGTYRVNLTISDTPFTTVLGVTYGVTNGHYGAFLSF